MSTFENNHPDPARPTPPADAHASSVAIANAFAGPPLHPLTDGQPGNAAVLGNLRHDEHLCGIILHGCISDDDGPLAGWAAAIVAAAATYTEHGPSDTTLQLFFTAKPDVVRWFLAELGRVPATDLKIKRSIGANSTVHGGAVEIYCGGKCLLPTGKHWPQTPGKLSRLKKRCELVELVDAIIASFAALGAVDTEAASIRGNGGAPEMSEPAPAERNINSVPAASSGATSDIDRLHAELAALPIAVSLFPTAKPKGQKALGSLERTTWAAFCDLLRKRRLGEKDGPNFIPATFKLEPDGQVRRVGSNLIARTAIALDVETNKATGKVPPPFAEALARIRGKGWAAAAYTSYSHTREMPRYRIIVPLLQEIAVNLPAVEVIADLLGLKDVLDGGKVGAASVFYLPSAAPGQQEHHQIAVLDGGPITAAWIEESAGAILAQREAEQARQRAEAMEAAEKRQQERIKQGSDPNFSLIEAIRDRLDLRDELISHRYLPTPGKADLFLFDGSQTRVPGVYILHGQDGVERVYSHHSGDPLAPGNLPSWCGVKAPDVVDTATILEFAGDRKKALRTLAYRFGIGTRIKSRTSNGKASSSGSTKITEAQRQARVRDAVAGEASPEADAKEETADDIVAEFNKTHFVLNEAGRPVVYTPRYDTRLSRVHYDRSTFSEFKDLYLNRDVNGKTAGEVWLRHPERREYLGGLIFDPTERIAKANQYNLWQGFAVDPKLGSWVRMKTHIRDVICSGNDEYCDYLINWCAHMVQHPEKRAEVVIVLRGDEGTGKGVFAHALLRLLGSHGLHISNPRHLVGNFNLHLRDCVLLFADECFYAGDKTHVGVLKSLVTESMLTIEGKFQNVVQTPNHLHIVMCSNEDWVVPASITARRFFVLDVPDIYRENHAYFKVLDTEMTNGGYEGMLHDMLHRDISGFNIRAVPQTTGLQDQKKLSLNTTHRWWNDVLHQGFVFVSKLGLEDFFSKWHDVVTMELLFLAYTAYARAYGERHPLSREQLGRFLSNMGGKPTRPRDAVVGEHLIDAPSQYGGTTRKAEMIVRIERSHGYALGSLKAARTGYDAATGLYTAWPPEDGGDDDLNGFIQTVCTIAPSNGVEVSALFGAWSGWCTTRGLDPGAEADFIRQVSEIVPSITRTPTRDPITDAELVYLDGIGLTGTSDDAA